MSGETLVREEFLQRAAQPGERTRHRAVEALGRHFTARVEVDQPHGLAVTGLGEGVRERGPGVADARGEGLTAVQVAEGGVVDPVEDVQRDGGDAADGDVAFAVAGDGAGHEGVGEDDRAGTGPAVGEIGADPVHGRAQHGLVTGPLDPQRVLHQGRFEIGQTVEGDVAVVVAADDRVTARGGRGTQVDTGPVDEPGADTQAAGGVVVAGDHHGGDAGLGEPVQRGVEELDGGERRHRPVVDVPGDHDHVRLAGARGVDEVGDEVGLRAEHAHPVERAPQVPVRGVQNPHRAAPTRVSTRTVPPEPASTITGPSAGTDHANAAAGCSVTRPGHSAPVCGVMAAHVRHVRGVVHVAGRVAPAGGRAAAAHPVGHRGLRAPRLRLARRVHRGLHPHLRHSAVPLRHPPGGWRVSGL